jgi:hypothetical protein
MRLVTPMHIYAMRMRLKAMERDNKHDNIFKFLLKYKALEEKWIKKVRRLEKQRAQHDHTRLKIITSEEYDKIDGDKRPSIILSFLRSDDGQALIHKLFEAHEGHYDGLIHHQKSQVIKVLEDFGIDSQKSKRNKDVLFFIQSVYNNANWYLRKRHRLRKPDFSEEELLSYSLFTGKLQTEEDMDALESEISQLMPNNP